MLTKTFGSDLGSNTPLTVSLHGFPAVRSKQNVEIAERLAEQLQSRVEVLFYSGLGIAPGIFRFQDCLREVTAHFRELVQKHPDRSLDIVGHSWGGFLALAMAQVEPVAARLRKMVLISPLLRFAPLASATVGIYEYVRTNPELHFGEVSELAADYVAVSERSPAAGMIQNLPSKLDLLFLQSRPDEVTPAAVAQEHLPLFPCSTEFELVENDHGFMTDRRGVADRIALFLKG